MQVKIILILPVLAFYFVALLYWLQHPVKMINSSGDFR